MYDSDEGSTLRGIFLTGFTAFLLSASFIFCFHLVDPDVMSVEPEVAKYESFFIVQIKMIPNMNQKNRKPNQILICRSPQGNGGSIFPRSECCCHPVLVLPVSALQNTKNIPSVPFCLFCSHFK